MFNLDVNHVPLIGRVKLALILALSLILTSAAQADAACEFDDLFYDIKLLDVSSQRGFEIDSKTKSVLQFGECRNHALLELDDKEVILFDLDAGLGVSIRLIGREEAALVNLRASLNSSSFWNSALEAFSGKMPLGASVELKALWFEDRPVVIFYQSSDSFVSVYWGDGRRDVRDFVTARVNEPKYMEVFLSLLGEVAAVGDVTVAGDQGFVLSTSGRDTFVSYPDGNRHPICPYSEIIERVQKLPLGVIANSISPEDLEYRRLLVNLTNFTYRSKFTSISFGCME